MEAYAQTPPVGLRVHAPQQTFYSKPPSPTAELQYYMTQQGISTQQCNQPESHGLRIGQSSSQPVSRSSNCHSGQMPQTWFKDSQNQLRLENSDSLRAVLPKGHFAPLPDAQHGTSTQNIKQHSQTFIRNTVPQQNYNMATLHYASSSGTVEQNNLKHRAVLPQQQSLNRHHNTMQIAHQPAAQLQQMDSFVQIVSIQAPQNIYNNQGQLRQQNGNGALYSPVNHTKTHLAQRRITPSQPPPYRTGSHFKLNGNKHQTRCPSYYSQHFVIQSQPNQRTNQTSGSSLPQDNVQPQTPLQQCNTIPVSGHHSKTCRPNVPAIQGNAQTQVSQLSNTNTEPSLSYSKPSLDYTQVTLLDLLLEKDNTQVPALRKGTSPVSHRKATFTTQGQTARNITTKESFYQTSESAPYCNAPVSLHSKELQRVSEYQTPVKRPAILEDQEHVFGNQLKAPDVQSFEGMQSRRLLTDSNTERKDGHKSSNEHREVQYSEDPAETLELVMALQKLLQQSRKAVAVVPPISQQVPSPEKNDHVTKTSDDGSAFKIHAVCTLVKDSENVEQDPNALNLPKETIKELRQLFSVPQPETQEGNHLKDGSTVDSLIPNTQSTNIQSKMSSNTSPGPVCSTILTSQSLEDHSKVKTGKSNENIFDLSKVQVVNFTLEKFHYWMKVLESTPETHVKYTVADVQKCLLDLYWDGHKENFIKQIPALTADLSGLFSKVSVKEMQTTNFQYLHPKYLKMLAHQYHISQTNDTNLPSEEFRSSWLNTDSQPADIESVLAEPVEDSNFADYPLHAGFNTLSIYSESETCTKVIPATPVCQNDKASNKVLENVQRCESKSPDEASNTQDASKEQEDEDLKKPQQQDVNMNPEDSVESNEMADMQTESKSRTACEQVCRDARKDTTTPFEMVEHSVLSNDVDSSNAFQLIELSLLSSDDAKMLFKEYSGCDLHNQKLPSQLGKNETLVSATPDNESNRFCSSVNQIKFTCPHVTDIDCDGEHFCPRCWEETPLLNLDLDESLFSPTEGSPCTRDPPQQAQSCSPQSGKPDADCTLLSKSSSIADSPTPKADVFKVTMSETDPNSSDAVESYSSLSVKLPVIEPHATVCTEDLSFTMPVEEQVCETNSSVAPELPKTLSYAQNLVIAEQTKTSCDEVFPPKSLSCKTQPKLTKEIPAEDDLFMVPRKTVTKKASSTTQHPSEISVPPAEDGQNGKNERKDKREERKSPVELEIQMEAQFPPSDKADPNMNVCSESSSDSSKMTITEPDSNVGDSVQSYSSLSGESPDKEAHVRVCSESVGVAMPVEEQVCDLNRLSGGELPKAQLQTKTSREHQVSPPRYPPCKRIKVTKTISIPTQDDLFTPDIVVKKASSSKPHPTDLIVTPTEDNKRCKDERKERQESQRKEKKDKSANRLKSQQSSGQTKTDAHGKWEKPSIKSQVPTGIPHSHQRPAVAATSDPNKKQVLGRTNQTGQNKEVKHFMLYGHKTCNRNKTVQHQCRIKSLTAPVYVTVSNRPESSNSYTDSPSAKQKVYNQWRSMFLEPKINTSSHKKHQKHVKVEVKSRKQALKKQRKDRFTDGFNQKQRAKDFFVKEAKRLKIIFAEGNL